MTKERDTLIVGFAQGVQLVSNFVRAKVISIILGASGFGLYSILISTIMVFQQFCSIGINQSAIKELSESYNIQERDETFAQVLSSFINVSRTLAFCGGLLLALLSLPLSYIFFDDPNHYLYFIISGIALSAFSLSQSYYTVLQATKKLLTYSKISVIVSLFTVSSCALLTFLWGYIGLALSIAIGFIFNALLCHFNSIKPDYIISLRKSVAKLKVIITRGVFIMLGTFSITFFTLLLNAIISRNGLNEVGLYQAAISIMTQGLTIISIILASEFYPRISAIKGTFELSNMANDELHMLLIIITPISIAMMLFAPLVVKILYTPSFEIVPNLIRIMDTTIMFRVIWMICGFVILSRGEKYSYFIFDGLIGNSLNFLCALVGYIGYGLNGLAIGWAIGNIGVAIFLIAIVRINYCVCFNPKLLVYMISTTIILSVCTIFENITINILLSSVLFLSLIYAIRHFGLLYQFKRNK